MFSEGLEDRPLALEVDMLSDSESSKLSRKATSRLPADNLFNSGINYGRLENEYYRKRS